MMLQSEILKLPAPQFLTDSSPMGGAVQIKQQDLRLGALPLRGLAGLLMSG